MNNSFLRFRVFDCVKNKYVNNRSARIQTEGNHYIIKVPKNCIIERVTELYDVNHVPIFEGDVVCQIDSSNFNETHFLEVTWNHIGSLFWLKDSHNNVYTLRGLGCSYKVIGNIHENPELVE